MAASEGATGKHMRGATLAEMLVAVAVLAVAGLLVIPRSDATAEFSRNASAMEVVQALRYAQAEAQRSGQYRVFSCDTSKQQLRVFALLAGSSSEDTASPVQHPLDKKTYLVNLGSTNAMSNATLGSCSFTYADGSQTSQLAFGAGGAPVSLVDPKGVNPIALTSTAVTIGAGVGASTVQVDTLTGRVTLLP